MDANLQIRLPQDLKQRAENVAAEMLVSLSDVARIALKEKVESFEALKAPADKPEPAEVAA